MATKRNLSGIRGDSRTFNISVPDIDITGYVFRFTIKELDDISTDDTSAIMARSWNTHIDDHNTAVVLTPSDTAFEEGTYKYDIQMTSPGGKVDTLIIGQWEQINDVTKTTP
jgi:hypothetical protein